MLVTFPKPDFSASVLPSRIAVFHSPVQNDTLYSVGSPRVWLADWSIMLERILLKGILISYVGFVLRKDPAFIPSPAS